MSVEAIQGFDGKVYKILKIKVEVGPKKEEVLVPFVVSETHRYPRVNLLLLEKFRMLQANIESTRRYPYRTPLSLRLHLHKDEFVVCVKRDPLIQDLTEHARAYGRIDEKNNLPGSEVLRETAEYFGAMLYGVVCTPVMLNKILVEAFL